MSKTNNLALADCRVWADQRWTKLSTLVLPLDVEGSAIAASLLALSYCVVSVVQHLSNQFTKVMAAGFAGGRKQ